MIKLFHEYGYNFMTWNKLTLYEQGQLIDIWNEEQNKIKMQNQKSKLRKY